MHSPFRELDLTRLGSDKQTSAHHAIEGAQVALAKSDGIR